MVQVAPPPRPVSSLRAAEGDGEGLRGAWASRRIYPHGTFVGMAVQVRLLLRLTLRLAKPGVLMSTPVGRTSLRAELPPGHIL